MYELRGEFYNDKAAADFLSSNLCKAFRVTPEWRNIAGPGLDGIGFENMPRTYQLGTVRGYIGDDLLAASEYSLCAIYVTGLCRQYYLLDAYSTLYVDKDYAILGASIARNTSPSTATTMARYTVYDSPDPYKLEVWRYADPYDAAVSHSITPIHRIYTCVFCCGNTIRTSTFDERVGV